MPSVTLLDRRSLVAKDVLDFQWSPSLTNNMISYWSPAAGNHPAFINIVRIPDRVNVCSRQMFDVQDGKMVWQNDGDYLCVYMTKVRCLSLCWCSPSIHTLPIHYSIESTASIIMVVPFTTQVQNKKKAYVLMLFRLNLTDVPVEQVELTEPIQHVSWEPSGDRFVVCSIIAMKLHLNLFAIGILLLHVQCLIQLL